MWSVANGKRRPAPAGPRTGTGMWPGAAPLSSFFSCPVWRCARVCAMAAVAFSAWAAPVRAQVPVDSMEISSVEFPGAKVFSEQILSTAVVTKSTECLAFAPLCWFGVAIRRNYLDPIVLSQDSVRLRLFYAIQGYRETEVTPDTVREDERIAVRFRIKEGEPIRVVSIDVVAVEDSFPPEIVRNLPLRVNDPMSMVLYEATRDTLRLRLRNRGYAHAEVLANAEIPAGTREASVRYDVLPGPRSRFGPIEVIGAEQVDSAVVRRMLTFQPGDIFREQDLLESQRNLFAQAVFRHAEVRALPGDPTDSIVPVRVQVNEGDLHRVRTGLGMSNAEYLNAEVRWSSRSFRGGARRLDLRGTVANLFAGQLGQVPGFLETDDVTRKLSYTVGADFVQPWFLGPLNTFGAGVSLERQSIQGVFVRESRRGYLNFTRVLGATGSFSVAYQPELTELQTLGGNAIFCAGFTACGREEQEALTGSHWLAPLAVSYVRDVSNSIFAPTRGYTIRIDAEIAAKPTGSEFEYARFSADLIDYHTIRPGWVWALRLKPGIAHPLRGNQPALGVHPQKRYFAGGPNSVRGFAQYRLGPKLLTIDPLDLITGDGTTPAACTVGQVNDGSCDLRAFAERDPAALLPRPVGGAVSLVGNAEIRFPVLGDNVRGATFLDFGQVWESRDHVNINDIVWTPGIGVRYFSPIGPIRVDVGYYAGGGETLTVITSKVGQRPDGGSACISMDNAEPLPPGWQYCDTRDLQVLDTPVFWNARRSFFDRLQLHFSIGQAF